MSDEKIDLAELAELADYKTAPQIMENELLALAPFTDSAEVRSDGE